MKLHPTKIQIGTIGSLLLLGAVFAGTDAGHHLKAFFSKTGDVAVKAAPDDHLLRVAASQLDAARERIAEADRSAADLRQRREKLDERIATLDAQCERSKERLGILQQAMDKGGDFQFKGRTYSQVEVRADAAALVAYHQNAESEKTLLTSQSAEVGRILAANEEDMRLARAEFAKAETEIRSIELRLKNARAVAEAGEVSSAATGDLVGVREGLSRTLGELENRVNKLQSESQAGRRSGSLPGGTILWEDESKDGEDLKTQIKDLLGSHTPATQPSPAPAGAAPAQTPAIQAQPVAPQPAEPSPTVVPSAAPAPRPSSYTPAPSDYATTFSPYRTVVVTRSSCSGGR